MDVYQTEEEQVEAIKKWWKENGTAVVLGIVFGFGAIFGWREWQGYKTEQAETASNIYQEAIVAVRDKDYPLAQSSAEQLIKDYPGTTYAVFSHLLIARIAVENDDLDLAAGNLRRALQGSDNESLSHVIRIRLARVLIGQDKAEEAEKLLDVTEQGDFSASYNELLGDIKVKQGDLVAARNAYQESLAQARDNKRDISAIEIKLNNVGRE